MMSGRGHGGAARKTLLAPIHFIFKLLQQRSTVSVWLYEQLAFRIEGKIRVRYSYTSLTIVKAYTLRFRDSTNS
jgi:small nuclear ribonucleoprotein E